MQKGRGSDQKYRMEYINERSAALLRAAYVRAMEQRYGTDIEGWSLVGREEFGRFAPFEIPEGCRLVKEIKGPPKLLTIEAKYDKSLTLALLVECDEGYFLVFRGTIALYEWYYDLKFFGVSHPDYDENVKVHGGFWEIYEYIRNAVTDLADVIPADKKLQIFGHSLGGALSVFAALDLAPLKPRVFTLATPKPGNSKFADVVRSEVGQIIRFTLKGDPVPGLPPMSDRFLKQNFTHPGMECKLISTPGKGLKERFIKAAAAHLPSSYFEAAGVD